MGRLQWCCLLGVALVALSCASTTVGGFWEDDETPTPDGRRCAVSADCPTGMICESKLCRVYCSADVPCLKGLVCDERANVCRTDEPTDTDGDADGDALSDGDDPTDGDTPLDGDTPSDGDAPPLDGDIPADGDLGLCAGKTCPSRQHCEPDTGDCEYDPEHCVLTDCQEPSVCNEESGICEIIPPECPEEGCPDGTVCNERTGECDVDLSPWPTYCDTCFDPRTCAPGSLCLYDNENQEAFCAPPCAQGDAPCPPDSVCTQGVCQPSPFTCGNGHLIGGACQEDWDCATGHVCLKTYAGVTWPRGYCSTTCQPVQVGATCAGNPYTRCTGLRAPDEGPDGVASHWTCLHTCNNSSIQCRENYVCSRTSDDQSVCVPRN